MTPEIWGQFFAPFMPRIDLVNQRFGRLVVLNYEGYRKSANSGKPYWKCICDCGQECVVEGQNLRSGNTVSCGCYHKEKISGSNCNLYNGGIEKAEYRRQMQGAKERDLSFNLTFQQVKDFFSKPCYYCNAAPMADNRGYVRNGMDRWNNSIGYELENIVTCCSECNELKGSFNGPEFLTLISKIHNHQKGN